MLDRKKLNSIAQKLNVSINFDSDTPGIIVGHGESKKIISFDSLIGYFKKDDKKVGNKKYEVLIFTGDIWKEVNKNIRNNNPYKKLILEFPSIFSKKEIHILLQNHLIHDNNIRRFEIFITEIEE